MSESQNIAPSRRPEVLAPAGDEDCLRAAVRAGADAIYFGLSGFNARARATNFDPSGLSRVMDYLHAHGVKGYVTLNTLVFDHELSAAERLIRAAAAAGVDALIVQDLGVARLARALAPSLALHASTQMTCTDAGSVEFAQELGAQRVVLARELSLKEIAAIRAQTQAELEVFVHGALCVAYSGQCLTSEAIGGRSANRGACAQACRLPYDLMVDGVVQSLGDRAYLLSPQDLEGSAAVPELARLGVSSLKIEGRLKGPEYVAAVTQLYRAAVDALETESGPSESLRRNALLTYSRGSGPGFLEGVDHQRLVEGRHCDHRGLEAGTLLEVVSSRGKSKLKVRLLEPLSRGDGVLVEGGLAGYGEVGGRIWTLSVRGQDVERAEAKDEAELWLGPDKVVGNCPPGRRVFKNDDPALDQSLLKNLERAPHREPLAITLRCDAIGKPFVLIGRSVRGLAAEVTSDTPVAEAPDHPITRAVLEEKLGRLGDSPFSLKELHLELPDSATLPLSSLNRARRALVEALTASAVRHHPSTDADAASVAESIALPERAPLPGGLFVLCRTLPQAEAALEAGADGIYLDFLELTGTSRAVQRLRELGARFVGVAPPRIRKPGEEKVDRHLLSLCPDAILVRGLGALREVTDARPLRIGDFSLNVANQLTAREVLGHALDAFTPSFDLDAAQLSRLLATPVGRFAELVVHHPMPLFHMEHCVFAALLSEGRDYRSCGRPCEKVQVSLRDRAGMIHPVEADVGCRNTVFHEDAQSAASLVGMAQRHGVQRFRIELVRESPEQTQRIVHAYRALVKGALAPQTLLSELRADGHYGVVRGTLRVLEA